MPEEDNGTLAKLPWLQSQRVVAAETLVSSLMGFG